MSQATICGQPLTGLKHICAFVDSREQQYEILLPFLKEGIECEDCVLNIVAPEHYANHVLRLRAAGIDVGALAPAGRLRLHTFEDTYLKDGYFSADRMVGLIEAALAGAREAGFPALRGFGEMHWALSGLPGTEELVEYEARVNYLAPRFNDPLVCVYDINRFSGRVVTDILSTHPKVILAGRIYDNPYFLPPEQFLKHLELRRHVRAQAHFNRVQEQMATYRAGEDSVN